MARSAFSSAANVIASMAASRQGVAADTARVRSAAVALKPGNNLLDQKNEVQNFFDAARDALQAMSRAS